MTKDSRSSIVTEMIHLGGARPPSCEVMYGNSVKYLDDPRASMRRLMRFTKRRNKFRTI